MVTNSTLTTRTPYSKAIAAGAHAADLHGRRADPGGEGRPRRALLEPPRQGGGLESAPALERAPLFHAQGSGRLHRRGAVRARGAPAPLRRRQRTLGAGPR